MMIDISEKALEGIMHLRSRANDVSLYERIDHDELAFYKLMREIAPYMVELARGGSVAIRERDAALKALENARLYAGRLVKEWKETAAAKREAGQADQAEGYEKCCHALVALGIDKASAVV